MSDQKSCAQDSGLSFWLSPPVTYTHASRDSVITLCSKTIRRNWNRLSYSKKEHVDCPKCFARIAEASQQNTREFHNLATESALEDGLEAEAEMRKARGEGLYE